MSVFQALLLGMLQGLTEFLPVSSSGHLEAGNHFLHIAGTGNLTFALTVHTATVLSTLMVFRKDIKELIGTGVTLPLNNDSYYLLKLLLSALPVAVVGLFFIDKVESLFTGNLQLVGGALLATAALLSLASICRGKQKKKIGWTDSMLMGLAQAIAVIPGLSRSGITISTGLMLGNDRKETARFSFLMVLLPILGAATLDVLGGHLTREPGPGVIALITGFAAAFISGWFACRWMISIVSKGKLIYFAIYCLVLGLFILFFA